LLIATRNLLGDMEIKKDERSVVVIPLVLASMDTAGAMFSLLANNPEQYWVPAVAMRRTQMEYVMRAAFFSKAANGRELERFREKGEMPKRAPAAGKASRAQSISLAQVVSEACQQLGWDEVKLLSSIRSQYGDLSSLIHGGKEVLAIYTMNPGWGDVTIDWNELLGELEDAMVFVQLGLALGMYLSPMKPELLSEVVRPIYDRAHAFFGPKVTIE
jgi:hypothetical protein